MGGASLPTQQQHGRHVLGSLGSQENIPKQQVIFRGGKKSVLSPLAEHAHVAGGVAGTPTNNREYTVTSGVRGGGEGCGSCN